MGGMFSISVSRFISNTGDVDLTLCRLQKLVYHKIFPDVRHQVCPHVPFPKSIVPQLRFPAKSQKYEQVRVRSFTPALSLSSFAALKSRG